MKRITTGIVSALFLCGCASTHETSVSDNNPPSSHDQPETKPDAPLTANTHFAAGQVAESQGDAPRAISQYTAACDLDPTLSAPLLRLGMLYTQTRQFDQAVDAWNRYIKLNKDSAAAYSNLGYTLELAERISEAETAYKTALQHDPKYETARVNYGLMLARQGRLPEAIAQWQVVLTPAEVHYNLASILESQGKKNEAKAQYRTALQLDPDMTDAQTRLSALDTN